MFNSAAPLTLFDPGEGGEVEQRHAAGADEQHEDEDEGDGGVRPGLPAQDVDAPGELNGYSQVGSRPEKMAKKVRVHSSAWRGTA